MPEEINRISCDHMSTLLFVPSITGMENLKNEGFKLHDAFKADLDHPKVYHCGDVMFDNSLYFSEISDRKSTILATHNLKENGYILSTIHRDSNTDSKENMEEIFGALLEIQEKSGLVIVLPIHPRTKGKMQEQLSSELLQKIEANPHFKIIPPAGFLDIIALEKHARMLVTDSGGLQKEAYFFRKPCVILRPQTEWVEIVENGNAILADASKKRIITAFEYLTAKNNLSYPPLYGDGKAAVFICEKIFNDL
jgi:UDP-GlcNAc3NAcA epimerase